MYAERFQEFSGLISRAEKALQRAKAENVRATDCAACTSRACLRSTSTRRA